MREDIEIREYNREAVSPGHHRYKQEIKRKKAEEKIQEKQKKQREQKIKEEQRKQDELLKQPVFETPGKIDFLLFPRSPTNVFLGGENTINELLMMTPDEQKRVNSCSAALISAPPEKEYTVVSHDSGAFRRYTKLTLFPKKDVTIRDGDVLMKLRAIPSPVSK